jgi:hypothetical protein
MLVIQFVVWDLDLKKYLYQQSLEVLQTLD